MKKFQLPNNFDYKNTEFQDSLLLKQEKLYQLELLVHPLQIKEKLLNPLRLQGF